MDFDDQLTKDLCTNSLRSVLKQLRIASIQELSRLTGLENGQVEGLIKELCLSGECMQERIPGETEPFFRFNGEHKLVLAICVLEKNRVYVVVSDLYGEYLEREEVAANPDKIEFFEDIVETYCTKYPAIGLLAFGMAGFEVRGSGRLLSLNFPELEWVRFRDHFMEKYGLPSLLENDIKAAVIGYYETRDFDEGECVGALYIPQTHHPAAAICIDGKIYRGRDNAAGEVIFLDTDVQWKHFGHNELDYSKISISKLIADMALPLVVFLNPDCMVIYGNWLPPDTAEKLRGRLLESMPREFVPHIVFIPDILPDFLDGLVHLALKVLEPKIDLE
ncbi:MAG: hypothetical protein LBP60_06215 [Spirochaetaceae bacterium]|jgi:predicted NBD/HSP70 family sugar kinase|nr:hypothetical protein [Spirochaetaceae bacterium]